jgi:hypothetical protein
VSVAELFLLLLGVFLMSFVPYELVRHDERQLSPEQLERAWNPASFWVAIIVFGPLSLPVHFTRTRRSLLGLLLGVGHAVDTVLTVVLPLELLGRLLGVE